MFAVVSDLLMQNKLSFEKNGIYLLGNRMSMFPAQGFFELQKQLCKKGKEIILYKVFKFISECWVMDLKKKYNMSTDDLLNWARNSATLSGWGQARIIHKDFQKGQAIFKLENSVIAKIALDEKLRAKPVDHMFRGLIAGTLSVVLSKDLHAVETTCHAMTGSECSFVVKPLTEFDLRKKLVRDQLGQLDELK